MTPSKETSASSRLQQLWDELHRRLGTAIALARGQAFLFPRPNTCLLRIYGRLRCRGPKHRISIGRRVIVLGDVDLVCGWDAPGGRIVIGDRVIFEQGAYINAHGGSVSLADGVFVGVGSVIQGKGGVIVGASTLLGPFVQIFSSDHPSHTDRRPRTALPEISAPVVIGEDVWLGASSIVLKGSLIASGCVVAAGSVVRGEHPSATLLATRDRLAVELRRQ